MFYGENKELFLREVEYGLKKIEIVEICEVERLRNII